MKRVLAFLSLLALASAAGLWALWPAHAAGIGKLSDHALIDQTGGDVRVWCRTTNSSPFNVYLSVRAFGGPVTMRVRFQDGDWVDYPLAQDEVFSLHHAAGGTDGVDNKIRVEKAGGTGSIVGWMSANGLPGSGSRVFCDTV